MLLVSPAPRMYRFHLARNLRSLAFLLVAAMVVTACGVLWWANRTGLPESWRMAIEREISKKGVHVKIGRLSYLPLQGVIASQVRVFSDPGYHHEVSRVASVLLDFDKPKLARGLVDIVKIELKDAQLSLPIDPQNPQSQSLDVTGANGTLFMPGGRRLEIRNARGRIEGIEVALDARLIGYRQDGEPPAEQAPAMPYHETLARIMEELGRWHFAPHHPPELRISVEGNANDPSSISAKLALRVNSLEKNHHTLENLAAEAEISGDLITVTSLHATDTHGSLDGHLDYDIGDREGRFDVRSSLEIPGLLDAWFGIPPRKEVTLGGGQTIEAAGDFLIDKESVPRFRVTGHVRCDAVTIRHVPFTTVQSAFSWRDGELFLRDLRLLRPDGEATGKAMIQPPLVRLALETNLPIPVGRPFFVGQQLEEVLNDFTERKGAEVKVTLEGGFSTADPKAWAYTGTARVKNVNYKGVPVNLAECRMALSHRELDFTAGNVVFNYQNYPLREAFNGPKQGTVKVARVRYDATSKMVEIEDVVGAVWAAPLVRLFAPKVADSLEIYRFHRPPELRGGGTVDVTPAGRTSLNVAFNSESPADYRFLGQVLTLEKPTGKVAIRGERVTVDNLHCNVFDGPVAARFDDRGKSKLEGELSWTKLSLPALASTYGFQIKSGGNVTGRVEFTLNDSQVATMNGEGLLALNKTELFSVPIFGPLSPLISGVLNNRRLGFQDAKSAFFTFRIKDGILSSRDFRTTTPSLVFAGDGTVDLQELSFDMTLRMNARGLLGLITLPLRPFYGMFQFRGTGPLRNPKWENVMFTAPPEEQQQILRSTPKAKVVVGDE